MLILYTSKPQIIFYSFRAILGSLERYIAILTENFGGKWPFWLSPRQAMVVPVGPHVNDYAQDVRDNLKSSGYCADVDVDDGNTMNKKVRNAQIAQYNFILGKYYRFKSVCMGRGGVFLKYRLKLVKAPLQQ